MIVELFNHTNWDLRLESWEDDDAEPYFLEPYQQVSYDVWNIYLEEFDQLILEEKLYIQNHSFAFLLKANKMYVYERTNYTAHQPNILAPWIYNGNMFANTQKIIIHNVGQYNIHLYNNYTYSSTVLRPGEAQLHTGGLRIKCKYGHNLLFLSDERVCSAQKIQYDNYNLYVHS